VIVRRIPYTAGLVMVLVLAGGLTGTHTGPLDPALRRIYGFAAVHLPAMAWSFLRVPEGGRQISADAAHAIAMPLGFLAARRWGRRRRSPERDGVR